MSLSKELNIRIGNKDYKVSVARTEEEKHKGLQGIKELPKNEGMLFLFDDEEVSFWMKDTEIPLDIIFINDELEVISVHEGIPGSEEFITENNVNFVLEVNKNSGIQEGDELEISPESKIKQDKMLVLDRNGNPQMELKGGERIFSRNHTKALIRFAKKAASTESDNDYKNLGKKIFKFLQIQSETDPEYVENKK